jgi:hypothetical protein
MFSPILSNFLFGKYNSSKKSGKMEVNLPNTEYINPITYIKGLFDGGHIA